MLIVAGEHGDSEVALWSHVHVAGMPLTEYCPSCDRGHGLSERKRIFDAVLQDQRRILTVSTLIQDYAGISDVCLSLPCVVRRGGVEKVIKARPMVKNNKGRSREKVLALSR